MMGEKDADRGEGAARPLDAVVIGAGATSSG